MNAKKIALIAALSAVTIVIGFGKGLGMSSLPGLVEFMTVTIFVGGFCFGWIIGSIVGGIATAIYMLVPAPFTNPAAYIFVISPVLLAIMAILGALYGVVGGLLGKWRNPDKKQLLFVAEMAFWGFILTFIYDIFSSIGFYLAYPVYSSVFEAIYLTFIPLYLPYPPIVHTFTNTIVFALVAPPLVIAIQALQRR
jgi:hypothetical protein